MTIYNNDVQEAIISKLKADSGLTDYTTEIREDEWQGRTFTYPIIRVDLLRGVPQGEGSCEDRVREVVFSTIIKSKQTSSKECNDISELVIPALNGKHLSSDSFTSGSMRLTQYPGPRYEPVAELWSLTLTWEVDVYG